MNEDNMIQEQKAVSLTDLIASAEHLAERAQKVASSFECLREDLTGIGQAPGAADANGTGPGGHIGALEARLGRIASAIEDLERCWRQLGACIGDTPKVGNGLANQAPLPTSDSFAQDWKPLRHV